MHLFNVAVKHINQCKMSDALHSHHMNEVSLGCPHYIYQLRATNNQCNSFYVFIICLINKPLLLKPHASSICKMRLDDTELSTIMSCTNRQYKSKFQQLPKRFFFNFLGKYVNNACMCKTGRCYAIALNGFRVQLCGCNGVSIQSLRCSEWF